MRITIAYEAWHFDIFSLDELKYFDEIEKLNLIKTQGIDPRKSHLKGLKFEVC